MDHKDLTLPCHHIHFWLEDITRRKKKLKQFFSLHLKLHSVKKTSGLFPSFKLLPSRAQSWLLSLEAGLILLDFESLESVVSADLIWVSVSNYIGYWLFVHAHYG